MGYFIGRGAFHIGRSTNVNGYGQYGSENVGLSSENNGKNPLLRNPKDSSEKVRPQRVSQLLKSG